MDQDGLELILLPLPPKCSIKGILHHTQQYKFFKGLEMFFQGLERFPNTHCKSKTKAKACLVKHECGWGPAGQGGGQEGVCAHQV